MKNIIRKKKGISQEELAEKLNTKGPVIGRYERDEMKPGIKAAAKIADILDVSLDWLVGHTDLELDKSIIFYLNVRSGVMLDKIKVAITNNNIPYLLFFLIVLSSLKYEGLNIHLYLL